MASTTSTVKQESAPFGALLLHLRTAAGLTQEQLAARAGLSAAAITALESGKRRTPRFSTVELLATALELDAQHRQDLVAAARALTPTHAASSRRRSPSRRRSWAASTN